MLMWGQNLAPNGGFEEWDMVGPLSWSVDTGLTATENTSVFSEGSKSASFQLTTPNQSDADVRQLINFEAATIYNVSVDVYHLDNGSRVRLTVDGDYGSYSDPAVLNQWQTISYSYLSPDDGPALIGFRSYDVSANWTGSSDFYIDNFVVEKSTATDPIITISDPMNGESLPEGTTSYTMQVAVNNFNMPADGHYHVILDGNDVGNNSADGSLSYNLTGLTPGSHTVKVQLYNPNHQPLSPEVSYEIPFTVVDEMTVADLATLRAQNADGTTVYKVTGQCYINFVQAYRNQKFIQDNTAGILIDDPSGVISPGSVRGDGFSFIRGTLSEYNGMLQLTPTAQPNVWAPSGLTITPQNVTLSELTTNFEDYEAELVKVEAVTVDTSSNTTFVTGTSYALSSIANPSDTFNLYTSFYDADYIGTNINASGYHSIVGIPFERGDGVYFAPRDLNDFNAILGVEDVDSQKANIRLSNTYVTDQFSVLFEGNANVHIFDMNGKLIYKTSGEDKVVIPAYNWTSGTYLVRVEVGKYVETKKIIKK